MPSTPKPRHLQQRRDQIKTELADIGDLRPGSLVGRYRKCGKPNCHCAGQASAGHGPSWSLTRGVHGKTVTKIIPASAVPQTKEQIAECRRFRRLTRELVEVSEHLCDAKLTASEAALQEGAKKGGSKKPSTRRSQPRSKRS
jgi:Family of unknown function (DUF6788)